jgi:RHS repeat-associated protein
MYNEALSQNLPVDVPTPTQTNFVTFPTPIPATSTFNYQQIFLPQKPIADATTVTPSAGASFLKLKTVYTDGWGKNLQTIDRNYSLTKDLITPYDNRVSTKRLKFLPYPATLNSGFSFSPYTDQDAYYGSFDEGVGTAVFQGSLELDPSDPTSMSSVEFTYNPGLTNVGQSHGTKTSNNTNVANEIIMWDINPTNGWPRNMGYYPQGVLFKKITVNADGAYEAKYFDNEGKLICKKVLTMIYDCSRAHVSSSTGIAGGTGGTFFAPIGDQNGFLDPKIAVAVDNTEFVVRSRSAGIGDIIDQAIQVGPGRYVPDPPFPDPVDPDPTTFTDGGHNIHFQTLQCQNYILTYYVYDIYDRLTYTLHPKAVQYLATNGWVPNNDIIDNLCDFFIYDNLGRVSEKHLAGEVGNEQFVYDHHSRLALTKKPKDGSDWDWYHYDNLDRNIGSGIVTSATSRQDMQNWFENYSLPSSEQTPSSIFYYLYNQNQQGVYPSVPLTSTSFSTINFYDNYSYSSYYDGTTHGISFTYTPSLFTGWLLSTPAALAPPSSICNKIQGRLVFSVTKVVKPFPISNLSDFITKSYYYDEYGHAIQIERKNALNGTDHLCTQYDFRGRGLANINYYENPSCSANPKTKVITHYYFDDRTMNLKSVGRSIDGSDEKTIATYTYNDLNQMSYKTIGEIESQKLDYNIRGQLTGINAAYAESGDNEGRAVTFGESIKYDQGFTNNLFCGNISGIKWKSAGYPTQCYGYTYDLAGRLMQADFRELSGGTSGTPPFYGLPPSWNNTNRDFTEGGYKYDANGNLINLLRYGPVVDGTGASHPGVIDNLSYQYESNDISNRIQKANDAIDVGLTGGTPYDFKNGTPFGLDYTYDDNGNATKDMNAKNTGTSFTRNNQPAQLTFNSTMDKISYVYDQFGNKIEEIKSIGGITTTTDNLDVVQYENNALKLVGNMEGYSVPSAAPSTSYDYYYLVRDHLKNVRNTLFAQPEVGVKFLYKATHEPDLQKTEDQLFNNIDFVRAEKPNSQSPDDTKCAMLDASDNQRTVGTSLLLKVMAGDQLDISAESFYSSQESAQGTLPTESMFNAIVGAFANASNVVISGEASQSALASNLFSTDNVNIYNALSDDNVDPNLPQAFLNYISFDDNYNIIPEQSGRVQIGAASDRWNTIGLSNLFNVRDNGYVVIYVSTATVGVSVGFDNIAITHYKGNLMDVNHYYPFGLAVNLSAHLPTASNPENKYLYQTNKQEDAEKLYLVDFGARTYDPQLGRFVSVDKMNQFPTGYCSMGNNPVLYVDPTGNKAEHLDGENESYNPPDEHLQFSFVLDENGDFIVDESGNVVTTNIALQDFVYHAGGNNTSSTVTSGPDRMEIASYTNFAIGTAGSAVEIANNSGLIANPYIRKMPISKLTPIIGKVTFVAGVALDAYGVYIASTDPRGLDAPGAVNPLKMGSNTLAGFSGLVGGAAGAIGATMYFGLDLFYPGHFEGAMRDSQKIRADNQAILGPTFELYPKDQ